MKQLLMNNTYPAFCEELAQNGYQIIPSKKIEAFSSPEQRHADMQALSIYGTLFTIENCSQPVGRNYPDNVRLNCLYIYKKLYGNLKATDSSVLDFCQQNNIRCVHVNQGYTRCSALVIDEHAVITADKSIQKALQNDGVEVLFIQPGHIRLEGLNYGFIGGASFTDEKTVYFFGDITRHPDYQQINRFCERHHAKIKILCKTAPLTDIGGAVILKQLI